MALLEVGVGELFICVVLLDEVLDDCAGLPEGEVCVGVVDGGIAAVGVDVGVGFAFDFCELDEVD